MKKYRVCNLKDNKCAAKATQIIKTATGLEAVSVDVDTGEVTYSPLESLDEEVLQAELKKSGYELERKK